MAMYVVVVGNGHYGHVCSSFPVISLYIHIISYFIKICDYLLQNYKCIFLKSLLFTE